MRKRQRKERKEKRRKEKREKLCKEFLCNHKMSTSARRRLMRDFKRLQNEPPPGTDCSGILTILTF